MIRFIIFCVLLLIVEFYSFQLLKLIEEPKWFKVIYSITSVVVLITTLYMYTLGRHTIPIKIANIITGVFLVLYISKAFVASIFLVEDIFRYSNVLYQYLKTLVGVKDEMIQVPARRKFIKQLALGLAGIPFASLLYGIFNGKYNFKVLKYTLYFKDLPDQFEGYQLTQISDIHSGSFDNRKKIEYAVNLINQQQSNVIVFTGDMVNLKATEMEPWKEVFAKLEAEDGMYSVLGNHDYGDYVKWDNEKDKRENLEKLKQIQKEIGFKLLLNQSHCIKKDSQKIAIVGVENWGKGFRKNGDLKKASKDLTDKDFKIVLSHDPTHWEEEIVSSEMQYHLTLSGHTHGMQMGIEIPGWIKWSPIKWRYKYWAGIYRKNDRFINVNRGFGFLAYPGRIGIWPEITVIQLRKTP